MLLIIILLLLVIVYLVLRRPRMGGPEMMNPNGYGMGGGFGHGMGGMVTGAILGYLLSEALIDHHQYEAWQDMNAGELRQTLADNGVLTPSQFDNMNQQYAAGDSNWSGDSQENGGSGSDGSWDSGNDDYGDSFGGDDYGGDDF